MTAPFGPVLEAALKENVQGGRLSIYRGVQVHPQFYCCISGTSIGVAKDPVAMLHLSAGRVCIGDAITADYSLSWSPSSTIATWSIDWGDGNVSGAAWPGAGTVAHPGGGYALDITYTVTLTVTDLLGATGIAQVQVEVIDCTVAEIDLFAGCGDSGPWKTETGGLAWSDVDYGVLDGVRIHDLKANWFTIGTESVEVWTATEDGVYTSTAGSVWVRKALPLPGAYLVEPMPVAITCSKYDPLEVYVLATSEAGVSWLYRTVDAGETWTYIEISCCEVALAGTSNTESIIYGGQGTGKIAQGLTEFNASLYALDGALNANRIGIRDDIAQTWGALGGMAAIRNHHCILGGKYNLWVTGFDIALAPTLQAWDGLAWTTIEANWEKMTGMAINPVTDYLYVSTYGILAGPVVGGVRVYSGAGVFIEQYEPPAGGEFAIPLALYIYNGELFSSWEGSPPVGIYRHLGGNNWQEEYASGGVSAPRQFIEHDGKLFAVRQGVTTALLIRNDADGIWAYDTFDHPAGERFMSVTTYDDELYAGTSNGKIFRRDEQQGWVFICSVSCDDAINDIAELMTGIRFHDDEWIASAYYDRGGLNAPRIFRLPGPSGGATPPTVGRTHLIDTSADGVCVYIALLNGDNHPFITRVRYDLSEEVEIYNPGDGTWGGVAADPFYAEILWMFGDFANDVKVLISQDWGETNDNRTDGSGDWTGAGKTVRPLLPSTWDSRDVVVILNTDNECWRTKDFGVTWVEQGGAVAFDCDCGTRDPFEPENIWIGRVDNGALHIQYSPNAGVNWEERSAGFEANAIVTVLQVTK